MLLISRLLFDEGEPTIVDDSLTPAAALQRMVARHQRSTRVSSKLERCMPDWRTCGVEVEKSRAVGWGGVSSVSSLGSMGFPLGFTTIGDFWLYQWRNHWVVPTNDSSNIQFPARNNFEQLRGWFSKLTRNLRLTWHKKMKHGHMMFSLVVYRNGWMWLAELQNNVLTADESTDWCERWTVGYKPLMKLKVWLAETTSSYTRFITTTMCPICKPSVS